MKTIKWVIVVVVFVTFVGCSKEKDPAKSKVSLNNNARVVFTSKDGRELTIEDISNVSGDMEYGIMSDIDISKEAKQLHDEARQLGAKGEYVRSIELLDEAQVLSPDWPYPTYDKAYTYLLMKDYAKSRECYKKTIELSPRGFFTAIAALDALNREADGDLPEGTYLAFMSLEWLDDPAQKARAVTSMVEQLPDFAPAWEKYASLSDDPIERVKRIEKGLAANPDAETKGMLLMNKAIAINMQGDNQAAIGVLGDLILDSEATFSSVNLAKQVLAQIAK